MRRFALPAWAALLASTLLALVSVGESRLALPDPGDTDLWLANTDPVIVTLSLVRAVAVVANIYLLASLALTTLVTLTRSPLVESVAGSLTSQSLLDFNRRVVELSLMSALVLPATAGASTAGAPVEGNEVPVLVNLTPATGFADPPVLRNISLPPVESTIPATPETLMPPTHSAARADTTAAKTWTVARGESLWEIAESVLGERLERSATEAELLPYWKALIAANQSTLADPGNPDLIFAGQVLVLP